MFKIETLFEGYHKLAEQNVKQHITVHFKEHVAEPSVVEAKGGGGGGHMASPSLAFCQSKFTKSSTQSESSIEILLL